LQTALQQSEIWIFGFARGHQQHSECTKFIGSRDYTRSRSRSYIVLLFASAANPSISPSIVVHSELFGGAWWMSRAVWSPGEYDNAGGQ